MLIVRTGEAIHSQRGHIKYPGSSGYLQKITPNETAATTTCIIIGMNVASDECATLVESVMISAVTAPAIAAAGRVFVHVTLGCRGQCSLIKIGLILMLISVLMLAASLLVVAIVCRSGIYLDDRVRQ